MRLFLLLLTAQLLMFTVNAQQINGIVKDAQGNPLSNTTIKLLKDSAIVKLGVSKENGAYNFLNVKPGTYRVSATHVGYVNATSAPFILSTSDVTVPDLQATKSAVSMKTVEVNSVKPMVEVKADKTILNVEGTMNSVGSDALELLRKSPGVLVDKDDNLSMNGKNGVQVYVDGRPTPLSGTDLANYLKSIQSTQIESIELITNPSAKYEAAGNAGIINIRLKKNKSFGTNGSVNAGYNIGKYSKYNAGGSLNYRNKNVNIFGTYNFSQGRNEQKISFHRTSLDTSFDNQSTINFDNRSHNFKAGADFFINKKSTFGIMANGAISDPAMNNYSRTPIAYIPTGKVDRILVADNTNQLKRNNINLNLNYSYVNPDGRSLTVNGDYGYYDINNDQMQPNFYYDAKEQNIINTVIYQMIAPTKINITSLKVDWEQNFKKGKLGYGGKLSFIKSDNDFKRYNVYTTGKVLDKDRSNQFNYNENINAGYINYLKPLKGFMYQVGLRVENTVSEGTSAGLKNIAGTYINYDSSFKRNYVDFFPSAAITFNKNPMSQVSFTYSRRIDRPAYQDLNPFEFKLDEYTFQKGNINIRPQYTNSFGITHTYKYKLNTTLNYSHIKDLFTQFIDTAEGAKAFISKKNLATQDVVSLNISYPYQYKSFSLFSNLSTNYSHYVADFGKGRKVNLDAFGLSLFSQATLKFAKTWTAELNGFYNAPTIYQGTFKAKSLWSINTGLQKQLWATKANIKVSVTDIFKTLKFTGTSDFAGQKSVVHGSSESRQLKLSFTYRFGSNTVKANRQRSSGSEDENKRTQSSSGLGVGGQ